MSQNNSPGGLALSDSTAVNFVCGVKLTLLQRGDRPQKRKTEIFVDLYSGFTSEYVLHTLHAGSTVQVVRRSRSHVVSPSSSEEFMIPIVARPGQHRSAGPHYASPRRLLTTALGDVSPLKGGKPGRRRSAGPFYREHLLDARHSPETIHPIHPKGRGLSQGSRRCVCCAIIGWAGVPGIPIHPRAAGCGPAGPPLGRHMTPPERPGAG